MLAVAVNAILVGTLQGALQRQELILALQFFHLLLDGLVVVEEICRGLWRSIPCLCGLQTVVAHQSLERCRRRVAIEVAAQDEGKTLFQNFYLLLIF